MHATLLCLCAAVLGAAAQSRLLDSTGNVLTLFDEFSKIQFTVLTNSRNASFPIHNASDLLADPSFDASKPTVLYIHGYLESQDSDSVGKMARAFQRRGEHNFVLVDWSQYVGAPYLSAHLRVTAAGAAVAGAVHLMVDNGLSREGFWPIGHSLGGQLAGVMAKYLNFKPYRITGRQWARRPFWVDVIHTDSGVFGSDRNEGTVDFWPNGGRRTQPGCSVSQTGSPSDSLLFCSHQRSWEFFAESVNDETAFPAVSCRSWLAFQRGSCPPNDSNVVYMGFPAPAAHQRGVFYLRTGGVSPFGLGEEGDRPEKVVVAATSTTTESTGRLG
ncbi:pancreatic triacylglycerol lipase-like [Thrips palmi]|uniref:Pancreatic triacylglycerol lipase-like n=1 Tax=Thrips palmi TaxID=161013 RepID=A0A6P8Z911_THRPL|nr:pancreatic triacylglycerol lipase-like [Thrips palmi]